MVTEGEHSSQTCVHLEDPERGLGPGLGRAVSLVGLDPSLSLAQIELDHAVRLTLMQVDRPGVDVASRSTGIDRADEHALVGDADLPAAG